MAGDGVTTVDGVGVGESFAVAAARQGVDREITANKESPTAATHRRSRLSSWMLTISFMAPLQSNYARSMPFTSQGIPAYQQGGSFPAKSHHVFA